MRLNVQIVGLGRYLPERIVQSNEVESLCDLPAGWIEKRSGVRERRWVTGQETNSFMGARAAEEAVSDAGLSFNQIDLILNASGTQEQLIPDGGALLQRALGLGESGIPSFSIHATCLSFLVAIKMAASLLISRQYDTILIVSSEVASAGLNFKEPESASLMGDGAAAVILKRTSSGATSTIETTHFATYGAGADLTAVRAGTRLHSTHPNTEPEDYLFRMEGPDVFNLVQRHIINFFETVRPGLSRGLGDIDLVIPHQASLVALRSLRLFRWPESKIMMTIDWSGNCIAASIPIALYEAVKKGRVQRGDNLLLVGTAAGLSFGAVLLRY